MVKKGSERLKKYQAKYDLDAIMLRWKALRDFSLERFVLTTDKHSELDSEISTLINNYVLPYGKAGRFMDKVRKLIFMWDMLTETQKALYRQEWINEGLPTELFDKIAEYYSFLSKKTTIYVENNMVLWYFAELSPLPQEAIVPKEEDYTQITESEYETYAPQKQPYWFQYAMSIGAIIYYFGNVFQGLTITLPLLEAPAFSYKTLIGIDLDLFIPSIVRGLPDYFLMLSIPDMFYEIEIPIAEIIQTLDLITPALAYGINEYDLWLNQAIAQVSNIFPMVSKTLIDISAYIYSVNLKQAQTLIISISNPSYEVSI